MGTATRAGLQAPRTRGAPAAALSEAGGGWRRRRHALAPYWFLLPYLVVFAVFWCWPIIDSALLSLQNTRVNPWAWNLGINWRRLLVDRAFQGALKNTLIILVIQVPVMLTLATLLAVALNSPLLKLRPIYRFAFFAPVVVSDVAYSVVFRLLFNGQFGAVNHGLAALGLAPIDWLHDPNAAMATIMVAVTWRWTGYNAIILLAGLQSIPRDLYEAAAIDGARPWHRFWRITLPLLTPVVFFNAVIQTIEAFKAFTPAFIISEGTGGPIDSTLFYTLYLYQEAFSNFRMGYASALAWVLVVIIALFTAFSFLSARYWVHYDE